MTTRGSRIVQAVCSTPRPRTVSIRPLVPRRLLDYRAGCLSSYSTIGRGVSAATRSFGKELREGTHRLGDEDHVGPTPDGLDGEVGVAQQATVVVIAGEVDRQRLVTPPLERRHDTMPVPRAPTGTGDEPERQRISQVVARCPRRYDPVSSSSRSA